MVLGVVDRVDTDGVDAELIELGDITGAASAVSDGVLICGGAAGLVIDAADVESAASRCVESWIPQSVP
jgi:hypothetical protein